MANTSADVVSRQQYGEATLDAAGLVLFGILLLAIGGELLVRGAVQLARVAGLTPAVIGLTVVAIGTSLPELVVSVAASAKGQADLAIANVIGSNIVNVTGTLGLAALVAPLTVRAALVRLEWPVLFLASAATMFAIRDGVIDRYEAGTFLGAFLAFAAYSLHIGRKETMQAQANALPARGNDIAFRGKRGLLYSLAALLFGLGLLIVGGDILVRGAVGLARSLGVTERVIGLTVVAIGTGAPEIAATVITALRRQSDLGMANLIGSNIFNLLGVLGVAALWRPLRFDSAVVAMDSWWMMGSALLLLPIVRFRARVSRFEGAVLLAIYAAYLIMITRTA